MSPVRLILWWRKRRLVGDVLLWGGLILATTSAGWKLSEHVATPPAPSAVTRTLPGATRVVTSTHTVRVHATVIRDRGHVVTVYVARTVFHAGRRVFVVHGIFRLHTGRKGATEEALFLPGSTVTVPVTVPVPGATTTVSGPTTTVTGPTTTIPPVTTTVTVPLPEGSSR